MRQNDKSWNYFHALFIIEMNLNELLRVTTLQRKIFNGVQQAKRTHQSSIINHQSSIINHQSSIINHQSSIINHQSHNFIPSLCNPNNSIRFHDLVHELHMPYHNKEWHQQQELESPRALGTQLFHDDQLIVAKTCIVIAMNQSFVPIPIHPQSSVLSPRLSPQVQPAFPALDKTFCFGLKMKRWSPTTIETNSHNHQSMKFGTSRQSIVMNQDIIDKYMRLP